MKLYLLNVIQPGDGPAPPGVLERVMPRVEALHQELKAKGLWVFAGGLAPASTSTVVRVKDGEVLMTDGPFAEGKEQVGGFCIVKAPDLDAALDWGRRFAEAITLPIEVRPFLGEP